MHIYTKTIENTGILYMKVIFDIYMLSLFMVMFISNYAFLLENPVHAVLDLAIIVFWIIVGYMISGQSMHYIVQKINFIFFQVALIYVLSLPLKAFFYSYLVFNFKIPEEAFGFKLLLSLLVGTCIVPILIGFLMIIAALLIYLTVYILTVFPYEQIIFHREPPFPAKILFPYHFVFSHYVIIASYLFYLMKYRAYHVLTLLMAILSSGYFYKKSVINRIISSDLYERAQNETAAKMTSSANCNFQSLYLLHTGSGPWPFYLSQSTLYST